MTPSQDIQLQPQREGVIRSSALLECLSPKQQYDRAYYLKNRDKKLAMVRARVNKHPTAISKKCVVCGDDFECGGPNAERSPKAFTCGDTCQSEYKRQLIAKYIKANYDRVRAKDNEAHKARLKNPTYKEREYEKNRARMRRYRESQDWKEKERAKNKKYRAHRVKSGKSKIYYWANAAKMRAAVIKHRSRQMGAMRLLQMLAISKTVTTE